MTYGIVHDFSDDRQVQDEPSNGGMIAANGWDFAGTMELIRHLWDSSVELNPDVFNLDGRVWYPPCSAAAFEKFFKIAGLEGGKVTLVDIATEFANFDDYWEPFLGDQGPASAYTMALENPARAHHSDLKRGRIATATNGTNLLTDQAWVIPFERHLPNKRRPPTEPLIKGH